MKNKRKRHTSLTKHHLIPTSRGGSNHPDNLIRVKDTKHQAYHTLFENALPHEAVKILVEQWFYTDKDFKATAIKALIEWLEEQRMNSKRKK